LVVHSYSDKPGQSLFCYGVSASLSVQPVQISTEFALVAKPPSI